MKISDLHPRRFFLDTWRELDVEAAAQRASVGAGQRTSDALVTVYVFTVVAISLTLQEYFGGPTTFFELVRFVDDPTAPIRHPDLYSLVAWMRPEGGGTLFAQLDRGGRLELWHLGYWASWRVLGFGVIPLLAAAVHPRIGLSGLGLTFDGFARHLWVYGVLFVPVLVAVIIVSFTEDFSTYYPFYTDAHRSLIDFAIWESFYVAQFLALELCFRGFMLQPLARSLGSAAIPAMMVPYVMIHYGKPLPECFAAIIAGMVLGTLAMRTRSIWAGFLIHVSVAVSMDLAAIWQTHWVD